MVRPEFQSLFVLFLITHPTECIKAHKMSAVKNVIFSIFKLKYGAHKSEAVVNFHLGTKTTIIRRKKCIHTPKCNSGKQFLFRQ